jgi:hypothetical protein
VNPPGALPRAAPAAPAAAKPFVVLAYGNLGMHCMNQDFSELCILPPYNVHRAQVIRRGDDPQIVTSGVTVNYSIPGNTISTTKTNFWQFAPALFGKVLPPNIGLTGNGLAGRMVLTGQNDWWATGIPITPLDDKGNLNPYQLAKVDVQISGKTVASTVSVIPVSWEINCNLCHNTPGISTATDILRKHDKLHGTNLEASKPVLCASCHADPALGTTGVAGVKKLSMAMHGAHAPRMGQVAYLKNVCYACHPGIQTQCQRDIHFTKGIVCVNCHGDMKTIADPTRKPWVDEPTCAGCHQKMRPTWQFEEPGKLFKDSRGHNGVHCAACHNPQHAIAPAVDPPDNAQAILQQGFAGTIRKCTVCHTQNPGDPFVHALNGGRAAKKRATVAGSYQISGKERGLVGNRVAELPFKGTLATLTPDTVQITRVYPNGRTSQTVVALTSKLNLELDKQSVAGVVKAGTTVTTVTLAFAKTPAGYTVMGSSKTVEPPGNKGVRVVDESSFTGTK